MQRDDNSNKELAEEDKDNSNGEKKLGKTTSSCNHHKSRQKQGIQLSNNMKYILQQEAVSKGIDTSLLKGNNFSHIIIKKALDDERMYLMAMAKRVLHCCPYHEEENSST